jgi:Bardet-Biedl syndrome 4 protein
MMEKGKEIVGYCCLKKAHFLDPFRWDINANLGLVLLKAKKYVLGGYRFVGAQMYIRSALKMKKDPVLYNMLAVCLCELGDRDNAEKCYEEIFRLSTDKVYKLNYLCLLTKWGDKTKCRELYQELLKANLEQAEGEKLKECKNYFD